MKTGVAAALVVGHFALVLQLSQNWKPAALFFLLGYGLVRVTCACPPRLHKLSLAGAIAAAVIMLFLFRSTPILHEEFTKESWKGVPALVQLTARHLPFVGVSYCFLRLIYALGERRRWTLLAFARYFLFLPTFVSGPVMSPGEFADQPARWDRHLANEGAARLLIGVMRLAAASIVANVAILGSREQFLWSVDSTPARLLWLGFFLSGFWLYLNFSGYTDLFIGFGAVLGYRVPENFDHPFAACDITAFWQCWHMSLGNWLRANIYNPLRRWALSTPAPTALVAGTILPVVTMVLCGAWHGVTVAFLSWGLLHGLALAIHFLWRESVRDRLPEGVRCHPAYRGLAWLATHSFVSATWILFLPVDSTVSLAERGALLMAGLGCRS